MSPLEAGLISKAVYYEACLQLKTHLDRLAPGGLAVRFSNADGCLTFSKYEESPAMHPDPTCHIAEGEVLEDVEPLDEVVSMWI